MVTNRVEFEDGYFKIDGKPEFLYGAEVHYFRIPKGEWQDRLQKVKEAGCNLVSTYIPWIWHEPYEGKVDLTGKTHHQRDVVGFLDLCHEMGFYTIVRPGPYVMAELVNYGLPGWLLKNYPEIIARDKNGSLHPLAVVSYLHPTYLNKVRDWYRMVMPIIKERLISRNGNIIMVQLCNEIGMLNWVSGKSDYSHITWTYFLKFLQNKYGNMEQLNKTYGTNLEDYKEISPEAICNQSIFSRDWGLFWRWYIKKYVEELTAYAKKEGIDVPILINVHGFKDYSLYSRGIDYPIGLSQLYSISELPQTVLAGDFYPGRIGYDTFHDLVIASEFTKAIQNIEIPLFSAEFQAGRLADRPRIYPQDLELNTRTCVAHGMNALNYYMFAGGVNLEGIGEFGRYHEWQAPLASNGDKRPSFFNARRMGRFFKTFGRQFVRTRKKVVTHVGFYPDYYMTETEELNKGEEVSKLIHERENFFFDGIIRLLICANLHFQAHDLLKVSLEELMECKTLWVFAQEMMVEDIQQKLVQYVQNGGKLILFPHVPVKNMVGKRATILKDALQIKVEDRLNGRYLASYKGYRSFSVMNPYLFKEDENTISLVCLDKSRGICGIRKTVGKGEVVVLGFGFNHMYNYQIGIIKDLALELGIEQEFLTDNDNISIVARVENEKGFISVLNYDDIPQKFKILRKNKELFDGHEITLNPRSGLILPWNIPLTDDLIIEYSTVEILSIDCNQNGFSLAVAGNGSTQGIIKLTGKSTTRIEIDGRRVLKVEGQGDDIFINLDLDSNQEEVLVDVFIDID
ncbi:hypothetical protein BBF96_10410 [Anoxybacter fermentans]|uniref:Uncharacterized protein n=1 Tax=Anoxybacter fermentans TaxID=1323375 RepID=A0A3Q9HQX5_9FIRM|nr:beta-galactosidase [Anoxybacter fermentans]AZR73760.1 hypothetical protein BBF96_10410 [Anoxybacter fermentans]